MTRTVFNALKVAALAALLSSCGLTQTVADSTSSTAKAIFYKQLKTLHLDFSGRAAANTDVANMSALSVPTLVRVYQLRDSKAMELAPYDSLVSDGDRVLSGDLLDEQTVVVKPGEGAQLSVPMDKDAQFVAVVALFHTPDAWRLVLTRDELDPERARVIDLGDNRLALRPLAKD
jgi:type VI secretion system protein VasD